jgi:hypothetical protein
MSYKRSIILLADGARYDSFEKLISEKRLPNIQKYLIEHGSFRKAVTVFPSTTGPAHMPFLTGCLPATCNVPGIRWFDKKMYARYGHGSILSLGAHGRYRSYVGIETFRINSDMRKDIYTIFEILPKSYSIFNSINRGIGERNLTRIMRIWYWYYGHLTDRWRFVDAAASKKIMKVVERDFDFLFVVLPGIDEYSHLASPVHEYANGQYLYLDKMVGDMALKLDAAGKLKDTLLWIVSDHGLSSTQNHFCVNTFLESRGIKTFYFPLVYRKGCAAANMVSGNGMTHIYFKGKEGWGDNSTFEDIDNMYPGLLKELMSEQAVDILAVRSRNGSIMVNSKRGKARIAIKGGKIKYEVDGSDPFGYSLEAKSSFYDSRDVLEMTSESEYPDAPYQLAHIFSSPRCGDVIISAAQGFDLRVKYEDPEHKASHGSLHREHMLVPLLCNVKLPSKAIRTVDVFPTYLKLMGRQVPQNIDGESIIS